MNFLKFYFIFILSFIYACSNNSSISKDQAKKDGFYYDKYFRPSSSNMLKSSIDSSLFFKNGNTLLKKDLKTHKDTFIKNSNLDFSFFYGDKLFIFDYVNNTSVFKILNPKTFTELYSCELNGNFKEFVDSFDTWGFYLNQSGQITKIDLKTGVCVRYELSDTVVKLVKSELGIIIFYGSSAENITGFSTVYLENNELKLTQKQNIDINTDLIKYSNGILYYFNFDGVTYNFIYYNLETKQKQTLFSTNEQINDFLLSIDNKSYFAYNDKITSFDLNLKTEHTIYNFGTSKLLADNMFNLIFVVQNKLFFLNIINNQTKEYLYNGPIKLFSTFSNKFILSKFINKIKVNTNFKISFYPSYSALYYGPRVIVAYKDTATHYLYSNYINLQDITEFGNKEIKAGYLYDKQFISAFYDKINFVDNFDDIAENSSIAIYKDSLSIKAWATNCVNYIIGEGVDLNWQNTNNALGEAEGTSYAIVTLGRGGSIVLGFDKAITNGNSFDFAVFENGYSDYFLELGYVEVSTDGIVFTRFPNLSYTANPVGAYENINTQNIYNLASKYKQAYGTPFDLSDLKYNKEVLSGAVDLFNINYIKIVDITGDGSYFDTANNVIYDPYKTYGSAGFDLDAIAVINEVN